VYVHDQEAKALHEKVPRRHIQCQAGGSWEQTNSDEVAVSTAIIGMLYKEVKGKDLKDISIGRTLVLPLITVVCGALQLEDAQRLGVCLAAMSAAALEEVSLQDVALVLTGLGALFNTLGNAAMSAAELVVLEAPALRCQQVQGMRVGELRVALLERGLDTSGLKAALVARLEAALD
jgi:hypothetical protein